MQKQLVILPVVLVLQNFVDLANPQNVIILRTLFIIVSGLTYLMWQQILQKIEAKRDMTPIWVKKAAAPSLASMFGGGAAAADANAEWLQTTYYEHEKTKASEAAKQLLTGGAMQFGLFSLWMNAQLPLAINLIMGPWGAYDDPVVKQYLLGERIERPYGEVLEDPATAAPAATASGVADAPASGQIADGPAAATATADAAVEETILRTWEAEEPVDVEVFDRLAAAGKPIATHAVASDGWTALMVVAGGPHHPKRAVPRLLELGAVPEAADKDGWTALSWAAFHDNAPAIEAICAHVLASAGGRSRLARLLASKSTGGETPGSTALEVAQQAKAEGAAAALRRFDEAGADAAAPAAAAPAPAAAAAPRGRSPSPSRQARAASPAARAASPAAVAAAPEPEPDVFAKVAEPEPAPAAVEPEAVAAEEEEEVSPSRSAGARRRRQQA